MIPKIDLEHVYQRLSQFKSDGKKIVGVFPHSLIPDELIYAAGAIPIKLTLGGDDNLTAIGTEYLTQATCPFARGCIGYFDQKTPIYTLLDAFVGGNFCNGDLCGSEMIAKFFELPLIKITFPTTIKPYSLKFLIHEFTHMKTKLETLTGNQILPENLSSTIKLFNELRSALLKLNQQMKDQKSALMGKDLQNLLYHYFLLGPEATLTLIQHTEIAQPNPKNRIPILLSGSGIALDDDLIRVIEELDARVVVNDSWSGIHFYNEMIPYSLDADLIEILAHYYLLKNESARMVPNVRRIPRVLKLIKEYNAKGVINHILKFCDPYIADRIRFKNALQEADVPVLELERDYSTSLEQLKTRIGAFLEMLC